VFFIVALEWKYTRIYHAWTMVSARGGMGISPPSNDSRGIKLLKGDITPQLQVFWDMFFLVLKILITLSVILRHLEAELSILRCLKLIRVVPHFF
jgi:hypothetical protein